MSLLKELREEIAKPSGLLQRLLSLRQSFVSVAQAEYDAWDQDEDGEDPELGCGGICQEIAGSIVGVCSEHGIDAIEVDNEGMGEQHVWVVAYDRESEQAYQIDIDPSVYETGGGYCWRKKPSVQFDRNDITISQTNYNDLEYLL